MAVRVDNLDDFFEVYKTLLIAGDTEALSQLYAEDAVMTSTGGIGDSSWAVGREQIKELLDESLAGGSILEEWEGRLSGPYQYRGPNNELAAKWGTFGAAAEAAGQGVVLTVFAVEVFRYTDEGGWQYISDTTVIIRTKTEP